jgi:hypothetical protein
MAKLLARLRRLLLALVVVLAVVYGADYVLLRYRVSANKAAFDTVTVKPYYAVPRKDNKLEYLADDPQDQTCVNSLFPHFGNAPCWYLRTHTKQRINL